MSSDSGVTFESLRNANVQREITAYKYRLCRNWTLSDWTNAMAGEAGEACNLTKKISLSDDEIAIQRFRADLSKEIADIVIYADLLAHKLGKNLPEIIQEKFNEVSERIGSNIRLV